VQQVPGSESLEWEGPATGFTEARIGGYSQLDISGIRELESIARPRIVRGVRD